VERFLGNDRAHKRLSRLTVADLADDALEPGSADGQGPPLPAGLTLRDALDALLGSENGQLRVLDGDGQVRGVVTVDVIGERLR
jgi:hypothetical protein